MPQMDHCPTCGRPIGGKPLRARVLARVAALLTGAVVAFIVHVAHGPDWAEIGFGLIAGLDAFLLVGYD